ncbi:MAG: hypothetical protein Q9209_004414 [Squamulea sp. 1 TL-2023]
MDKLCNPHYWRQKWFVSDSAVYASAFDRIQQIPIRVFTLKQQVLIFNHVSKTTIGYPLGPQLLKDHVELLVRFLAHPNKDFYLLQYPTGLPDDLTARWNQDGQPALLKIAEQMYLSLDPYYEDAGSVETLKLLACRLLDYQLSRGVNEQSVSYFAEYYESLISYTQRMATTNAKDGSPNGHSDDQDEEEEDEEKLVEFNLYSVVAVATSLDFYRRRVEDFPAALRKKLQKLPFLHETKTTIIDTLCDWINWGRAGFAKPVSDVCQGALTQRVNNLCRAAIAQEIMATYKDSFMAQPLHISIGECVEDLVTQASELSQIARLNSEDVLALKEAVKSLRKTQRLLATCYGIDPLVAYQIEDTFTERRQLITTVLHSIKELSLEENAVLMTNLISQGPGEVLDRNTILLLQSLIIHHTKTNTQSSEATISALSNVLNSLCEALSQPQTYQILILSMHCINIILHRKPRTISQWHTDQIMAVITTSASQPSSVTVYTAKQNGLQYLALCRVFSTILAFHRKRLGGRYHLILLALQALLRPLFIPYKADPASSEEIYTATHAHAYSRLLLQLADPPLSSVSSYSHRKKLGEHHSLNDPTKIAKTIAGQHLHYLIMTYCDLQLKGRLTQEVREKLRPGIWAVLDVIPQETMRVMNAGMDKAGRAVWKGLYEEWRRDGRGAGRGR